jgi:hypothetical protein
MRTTSQILAGDSLLDFLMRQKSDFKLFCERVLGMTDCGGIHPFQMEWFYLTQNNDRVMIQAPSGFSKTTILGVAYPLWVAFNYPDKQILIISKSLPQSKRLLSIIRGYIEDNELLLHLRPSDSIESWNKLELKCSNGCRLYCRPYSVNIKGERVDLMILDELCSYEDADIFFDHLISRLNPYGKIIGISTPEGPSDLMAQIAIRNGKDYLIRSYPAIINIKDGTLESGESIWPERFSVTDLMTKRREQGEQFFQKNFMLNVYAEPTDSVVFPAKTINACMDYSRNFTNHREAEDSSIVVACDFAISKGERADSDAFTVMEKTRDFYIIKHAELHKGWSVPAKIARIKQLFNDFGANKIIADESNIGSAIVNDMRAQGMTVNTQTFHSSARRELLVTLKNVIESGRLVIPCSASDQNCTIIANKLLMQLMGFKEESSKNTGQKLLKSKAAHDDLAISVAMAVKSLVGLRMISVCGGSAKDE